MNKIKKLILYSIVLVLISCNTSAFTYLPSSDYNNITDMDNLTYFPSNNESGTFEQISEYPEIKHEDDINIYFSFNIKSLGTDEIIYTFYNKSISTYDKSSSFNFNGSVEDALFSSELNENYFPLKIKIISTQSGTDGLYARFYGINISTSNFNTSLPISLYTENNITNPASNALDNDTYIDYNNYTAVDISTDYNTIYNESEQQYLITDINVSNIKDVYSRINITLEAPKIYMGSHYSMNTELYNYNTLEYDEIEFNAYTFTTSNPHFFNYLNDYTNSFYINSQSIDAKYIKDDIIKLKLYTNRDLDLPVAGFAPSPLYIDEIFVNIEDFKPNPTYNITNISSRVLLSDTPIITFNDGYDFNNYNTSSYIYFGNDEDNLIYDGESTNGTYTLGNNISLSSGTNYYKLATFNGHVLSNYSITYSFIVNSKPEVSNVSIYPILPSVLDNLSIINNTITDIDNDNISIFYKWYKGGILQSDLNTQTILTDNTSLDEIWKAGIIVNDGYENTSEILSQSVQIGSTNSAPTLTNVTSNIYNAKYNSEIIFEIIGENDVDNNEMKIEVGSESGLSDINISEYSLDNLSILFNMGYDDGNLHEYFIRLNDSSLTSQEHIIEIESDNSNPNINLESLSYNVGVQGDSFIVSLDTDVGNSYLTSVIMNVQRPDATTQNWTMNINSDTTCSYIYTTTSDIGTYIINEYYIADASGHTATILSDLNFYISSSSSASSGGSGSVIIDKSDGNLIITPSKIDETMFYRPFNNESQTWYYILDSNYEIKSCKTTGEFYCEIIDKNKVKIMYDINNQDFISSYTNSILTLTDISNEIVNIDVSLSVVNVGAYMFDTNIYIGYFDGGLLNYFVYYDSENGNIKGLRLMIFVYMGLFVLLGKLIYDGYINIK